MAMFRFSLGTSGQVLQSRSLMWRSFYSTESDLQEIRNKLLYRSLYRGTSENGIFLGSYARAKLNGMTTEELDDFQLLLNEQDPDLFKWISGKVPIPEDLGIKSLPLLKKWVEEGRHRQSSY